MDREVERRHHSVARIAATNSSDRRISPDTLTSSRRNTWPYRVQPEGRPLTLSCASQAARQRELERDDEALVVAGRKIRERPDPRAEPVVGAVVPDRARARQREVERAVDAP